MTALAASCWAGVSVGAAKETGAKARRKKAAGEANDVFTIVRVRSENDVVTTEASVVAGRVEVFSDAVILVVPVDDERIELPEKCCRHRGRERSPSGEGGLPILMQHAGERQ